MHTLEVVLVLVSPNMRSRGDYRCLTLESAGVVALPTAPVPAGRTALATAAELLAALTGLRAKVGGAGWVDLTQFPLVEETVRLEPRRHELGGAQWFETVSSPRPCVAVPFGAVVPGEVFELKDPSARWVSMADVFGATFAADHKTILQGVAARM